jgi:AraC-like DNA-binding protein
MGFLNFLTSISCFFLLLFSLHLFFAKQGNRMLNCLLSVIFFSRFGQMLVLLLINSKGHAIFPVFHQVFTPFYYAAPACFYLYITSLVNGRKNLGKFGWLHFIPVALAVVHIIPWPFSPPFNWNEIATQIAENKQLFITERSGLLPDYFYYLGRPILLVGYLIATWVAILTSKIIPAKKLNNPGRKWMFFFLKAATFFQLISFLPLISSNLNRPVVSSAFVMLGCLVLLGIMVFMLHNPRVFYSYLFVAVDWNTAGAVGAKNIPAETKRAYPALLPVKRVNLLPDQLSRYSDAMKALMEMKQPYLQPDFQIIDLAGELDIPVHHCSFIINNLLGKNFRDWINCYRIGFFIMQYPLKIDKMTIEAIARESGFKSLATFYNAFKKETGLMPTAYFLQKKVS